MYSIKVTVKNERVLVGKSGKPSVYKTLKSAHKAKNKIDEKYEPTVVSAIPVAEL